MPYIADIVNVLIFSFLGIILMIVGNMIIDQFIPGDFPTEIKKGNSAVAWVCAGSFIGMGEIVRTAIQSPTAAEVEEFTAMQEAELIEALNNNITVEL